MNTGFLCNSCGASFSVTGGPVKIQMCINEGGSCPKCGSTKLVHISNFVQDEAFTADEFWRAINGFGLPDEIATDVEPVVAMLLAHRVTKVEAIGTKTGRVELRSVSLDNGITIHLTASGEGAVVLKMTRDGGEDASRS
jgi:DNA-directed RNA polymerase subunit RPC12/RpoP